MRNVERYPRERLGIALFLASGLIVAAIAPAISNAASKPTKAATCDAPEYFGVCNAYVPGTIIEVSNKKPILVFTTWPGGPADRAGICAGDKIVAINGVSAYTHTTSEMMKQLTSAFPTPITLTILRGKQDMTLKVPRVRESTLVWLSREKYFPFDGLYNGRRLISVPLNEKREEVTKLEGFEKQLTADYGFEIVPLLGVIPKATPDENRNLLRAVLSKGGSLRPRIAGVQTLGGKQYWTGAAVIMLKNPEEALAWDIFPGSPAFRAGLLPGDQLIEVDAQELSRIPPVKQRELLSQPDTRRNISVRVKRGASVLTLSIETLQVHEVLSSDPIAQIPIEIDHAASDRLFLGAHIIYDSIVHQAALSHLDYPSPAFAAGLHPGDMVLALNGTPVSKLARAQINALLSPSMKSPLVIKVKRLGHAFSVSLLPVTHAEALATIGRKPTRLGATAKGCPG